MWVLLAEGGHGASPGLPTLSLTWGWSRPAGPSLCWATGVMSLMFSAREGSARRGGVVAQGPARWPRGPPLPAQGDSEGWTPVAWPQRAPPALPCFKGGCAGWGSPSRNAPRVVTSLSPPACPWACLQPVGTGLSSPATAGTAATGAGSHPGGGGEHGRGTHWVLPTPRPALGMPPQAGGRPWAPTRGCRRQRACPHSLARWCQENELRAEAAGGRAVPDRARLAGVPEQAPWLSPCSQFSPARCLALAGDGTGKCCKHLGRAVPWPWVTIQLVAAASGSDFGGDCGTVP